MDLPLIAQLDLPMDSAGSYTMAIAIDGDHTIDVGVSRADGAADGAERHGELEAASWRLHDAPRKEKTLAQRVDVSVPPIVQPFDRVAAAAQREMHHLPLAERDADVRDAAVVAIGEEQQIAGSSSPTSRPASSPISACCHASRGSCTPCSANTLCTSPEQSAPHGVTPPQR